MIQHKGYKYRIYPNKAQAVILSQFFGCCRFVYNRCLSYRKEVYASDKRNASQYECMRLVTEMRHDPDYAWLSSCDSMSLQEAVKDLNKAFGNFFGKRGGYPKFHKKSSIQSYRTRNQNGGIRIEENRVVLPKLGAVKAKISRCPKGRILNATVSRTATGKYFVSLCCEEDVFRKSNASGKVGLDLGIKELYVDSNGHKEPDPKHLSKYEKKLRRQQRSLSRMIEADISGYTKDRKPIWKRPLSECSNLQKQKRKIAAIHEKIFNCRSDHLHKVSSKLVNENQVIALETLNVKGMVHNHHLAKAISDASWSRFVAMLEYKAFEHGCEILKVPALFPSSQICSSCGYKNPKVKDLKVRRWICPECGAVHDRDENAAKNILAKALAMQTA
ncbi:MAG: IS200/IS605 family element transposase accessory protein TnpB [Erysipelotrichaceae bacterium]|nr:IS200/IS605 family element transposase accessory protein TnpB [Erysipelotrichaceae bacterium]